MKTPHQILEKVPYKPETAESYNCALLAMKEFGRQAWIEGRYGEDKYAEEAKLIPYDEWVQNLYLNQIAKESQERGEYEDAPKKCEHKNAYFFHENAPRYCPDCKKYIDGNHEV